MVEGLKELGAANMEDVLEQEPDAALGNGGLGRLAACFLDSLATLAIPAMGYGIRYDYGIFKQQIVDGYQTEFPDYWLTYDNPWEIPRHDVRVDVRFGGWVRQFTYDLNESYLMIVMMMARNTMSGRVEKWSRQLLMMSQVRSLLTMELITVPGYGNNTTNNLRLWSAKPTREFDLQKFNSGDYESSVREQQRAETISAVLYPNDNIEVGKELRLKQQYFWCCASLHDIVRRFKKTKRPWSEFPDQVAIQLNDTHPTLAIVELQRLFVDIEGLDWDQAWKIVTATFGYTNHTVMQEALEKWPVPLLQGLLPRHMQIIYDINLFFLQSVEKKFPKVLS
jgi:starch phosphorylase